MDMKAEIEIAERAIQAAGLSRAEFFKRAQIHHRTWQNWRRGNLPTFTTWFRVQAVIETLKRVG